MVTLSSSKDLIPPLLLDRLRAWRQRAKLTLHGAVLDSNLRWRDAFHGQTVYVIANGPSLAAVDRTEFDRHHSIVMNNFHRADWARQIRPVAHCIGEPPSSAAWTDPAEIIDGTSALSYWLHLDARGRIGPTSDGKALHYVLGGYEPRVWNGRRVALEGLSLGYQTTALMAIEVALYMGFKDIRLVGFDHDWLASPEYSKHFYSAEPDPEDKLGTLSYLQILRFVTRMWEGYYALRDAAHTHGATIVNCTPGSYLDVFERRPPGG